MTDVKFVQKARFDSVNTLELSPTQQKVRDLPANSITPVFGSPGSGKTTALVSRFLSLTAGGLDPVQIVVIAATRESANTLRDQLALEYQGASSGPLAKTLTSLAFSILAAKAKRAGQKAPVLVSGSEQDQLLKEVLSELDQNLWPKHLDSAVRSLTGFRTELRDLIAACLEHGISPAELTELGKAQGLPEWIASASCFASYLRKLDEADRARYDSASLLRSAAKELESLEQLPIELAKLSVILVDDAQELTPAAAELLFQLTRFGAGLMLIGDPDVATLGFRVANPKTMTELAERIGKRVGQSIDPIFLEPTHAIRRPEISAALAKISSSIDAARAGRQRKGLNPPPAASSEEEGLQVRVFRSESEELSFVAGELRRRHLFDDIPWSKMAVVARSRPALEKLALTLSSESVPVQVIGSATSLRDDHSSGQLLKLAKVCLSEETVGLETATQLLSSELGGLDQLGILRLKRLLRKQAEDYEGSSDQLLVDAFANPNSLSLVRGPEARKAEKLIRLMHQTQELAAEASTTAEVVLWKLVSETGVLKRWEELSRGVSEIAIQAGRNLDSILSLFAAAARFAERYPNALAIEFIQDQLEREIPEDSLALNNRSGEQVLLLTPSGLIGKRFDTVVLPGLSEGVWPNLKPRSSLLGANVLDALVAGEISQARELKRSELPGELRMLNKAAGACGQRLILTATDKEDQQLSQFLPLVHGSYPTIENNTSKTYTLRSIVGELRRELASGSSSNPEQAALGLARLAAAGVPGAAPSSWYGLLPVSTTEPLTDLDNQKLQIRPSQLDNFLQCPLHWFIETHGGSAGSFQASLGSLIHEVLEISDSSDLAQLEKLTVSRWNSLEFEADWLEDLGKRQAARMLSNLADYLKQFESESGRVLAKEQNFNFELGNISVRGQVDRIEQLSDGNVVIVDLKTGKLAATAADTLVNPQLALYQMAVLEGGFQDVDSIDPGQLAGAKLLIVGGAKFQERKQPAMDGQESARFKKLLLDCSEGMSKSVFVAQLSNHCESERSYGSCSLHLTPAVSYVG
jgi:superfamily I DNA/RNA helicase/RecB family exonuclease